MPNELNESLASLSAADRAELDRLLAAPAEAPCWQPLPGPQTEAYESQADVLLYGGAAGGGKTDLLLGLAATKHRRAIVFRREFPQLKSIVDRGRDIFGDVGVFNSQRMEWRLPGRVLELGATQHPGDERKYQGRPHDLKAFDEITHFLESQFRFLITWLRTSDPFQRTRVVAAGNPPTDAAGDWVLRYWGPWLDPHHARPARPGELRWYITEGMKDIEVESGASIVIDGEAVQPTSRTFIKARIENNPHLMASGYKAMLQALPEPLRSAYLEGKYDAAREDSPWQVIPAAWVLAAQARWTEQPPCPMTTIGVDVARGGKDRTVLSARHGAWFAPTLAYPGESTPDGPGVAALVTAALTGPATVNVDVIGVGGSVYDHLKGNNVKVWPMNASEGSTATTRDGNLRFANKRAEWWWKMREALDPDHGEDLALPPDRELAADLTAPRWKLAARGIQVEAKEDIIKRVGRSPDKGDAAVYALSTDGMALDGQWLFGDRMVTLQ